MTIVNILCMQQCHRQDASNLRSLALQADLCMVAHTVMSAATCMTKHTTKWTVSFPILAFWKRVKPHDWHKSYHFFQIVTHWEASTRVLKRSTKRQTYNKCIRKAIGEDSGIKISSYPSLNVGSTRDNLHNYHRRKKSRMWRDRVVWCIGNVRRSWGWCSTLMNCFRWVWFFFFFWHISLLYALTSFTLPSLFNDGKPPL